MRKIILLLNRVLSFCLGANAQFILFEAKKDDYTKSVVIENIASAFNKIAKYCLLNDDFQSSNHRQMWAIQNSVLRKIFFEQHEFKNLPQGYKISAAPSLYGLFSPTKRWVLLCLYDEKRKQLYNPKIFVPGFKKVKEFNDPKLIKIWKTFPPQNRTVSREVINYIKNNI